jgi:hypothetical protein
MKISVKRGCSFISEFGILNTMTFDLGGKQVGNIQKIERILLAK